MAGGMQRGGSGRSLAERAALSGHTSPPAADAPPPYLDLPPRPPPTGNGAAGRGGEGRHCWVHDPPDAPGTWPGLLVEWRQRHGGWQGRVTYAVTGPDGPALIETWLPAARLEPR
ncbi:hypothetical protein [Blastococcus sp. SYSU DS0617]